MKLRKFYKILLVLVVGGIVLAGGAYGAYKGYRAWRQARLVDQAREFLEKGEQRKALISLQRALSINNRDIDAVRMMAGLAEASRSQAALVWRHRAVELQPNSLNDRLALAQAAAMFRDFTAATNALAGVDAEGQKTSAYQNVAGGVASTMGRLAEAEQHFLTAAKLEPENPFIRLNLSVIRLQSTNEASIADARTTLTAITTTATNSNLRCRALRELIGNSIRTGDTNAAMSLADQLLKEPDATFTDRLMRLDVLGLSRNTEFLPALTEARNLATNSPATINEIVLWQMSKIPPPRTLEWIQTLPVETQTNASLALMTSDLRVAVQDWTGLASSLETQRWGDLEFIRLAFRTLALRRQNLNSAADAEWAQAIKAASAGKGQLEMLLRTVAGWRWPNEMREILGIIVGRYPGETWASSLLTQNLMSEGQTRPLLALFRQQLAANPKDPSHKNNVAMTALLLEETALKPHDLALEVYQSQPTNAAFASTYAFSLYLQQKHAEALQVIEKLDADQLKDPSVAGYYGLILAANGKGAEARPYFALTTNTVALPEERRLFDRAAAGL